MSQLSYHQQTATGADIDFTIDTFESDELKVYVDGVLKTAGVHYNINPYNPNSLSTIDWIGTPPNDPEIVRVVRETDVLNTGNTAVEGRATYEAGSSVKAADLNANQKQVLRALQEHNDQKIQRYDIDDGEVIRVALAADVIDSTKLADNAVNSEHYVDGSIDHVHLANDIIDGDNIQNDVINSEHIAAGAVDLEHMSANSVDSDQYVDGSIDLAHMSANSVDSDQYVDGSIDHVHLANDVVDGDNIQDNAINTEHITDDAVTVNEIAHDTITNAVISPTAAIAGTKITPSFGSQDMSLTGNITVSGTVDGRDVSADGSKLDGIESGATADQTASEIKTLIASSPLDASHLAADSVGSSEIAANSVTASEIANNTITENELAANAVHTIRINDQAVTTPKIANDAVTDTKLADHASNDSNRAVGSNHIKSDAVTIDKIADAVIVTNSEQAAHSVNDTTFFTTAAAEARYFNASTGETIKNGQAFPDNDTTIATTAAINDRIIDLVDDVGGFVPIANETSFPTANPDINNPATGGTIVSVKAASTNLAPSGTTVTIANGRGSGLAVIITGVTATIPSGFGFLVETTSTDHTYAFHRLVPKATEVTAVAGKATEIGRLGTAAAVEDMSILGTADVVADMAILGTADVVADLNTLGTADVVADLNTLGTADVVSDMNALATSNNITAMDTCRDNIASINNASANINSINNFGDTYQVNNGNPATDGGGNSLAAGDLYFDTGANELKVYNGSAWQGGVTATGNFASVTGNTFTGANRYNDSVKLNIGTGSDLQIYHNGANSYIEQSGTGNLFIDGNGTDKIHIRAKSGESHIRLVPDGTAELYYDNSKKFETTNSGTTVTGSQNISGKLKVGTTTTGSTSADDLVIEGDNSMGLTLRTNSTTGKSNVYFSDTTSGTGQYAGYIEYDHQHDRFRFGTNAGYALQIDADNTARFQGGATFAGGITFTGASYNTNWVNSANTMRFSDNAIAGFGSSDDLKIYHDGSNSVIKEAGTGDFRIQTASFRLRNEDASEMMISADADGAVYLAHNGTQKLVTTSSGVTVTGTLISDGLTLYDNEKLLLGNNNDLEIFHDGTNNIIQSDVSDLQINAGNSAQNVEINLVNNPNNNTRESSAKFKKHAAVELYYDNNKKLETRSDGLQVDGTVRLPSDSSKLLFGAGLDLEVYHDGTHSHIRDVGTGDLRLRSDKLQLMNENSEEYFVGTSNGAAELYYDDVKKLETRSDGAIVQGVLTTSSNLRISGELDLGTANGNKFMDVCLGDNYGFYMRSTSGEGANHEMLMQINRNQGAKLYYDAATKFETTANGILVQNSGTNARINFNAASGTRGYVYADNANNIGFLDANASDWMVKCSTDAAVELHHDGSKKLETTSSGISVAGNGVFTGNVQINDSQYLNIGNSGDLQLSHDGSNNFIDFGTGELRIRAMSGDDDTCLIAQNDGEVKLYYDNAQKFATKSYGAAVTGNFVTTGSLTVESGNDIYLADNGKANFGNSNDLEIYHSGTESWIKETGVGSLYLASNRIIFNNAATNETLAKFEQDGNVELYRDNSVHFRTEAGGAAVVDTNSSVSLRLEGTGGTCGYLTGDGSTVIGVSDNSGHYHVKGTKDNATELNYDNSKKFETLSDGVNVTGTLKVNGTAFTSGTNTPAFQAYLGSSSQSVSNASVTKVQANTEDFDTDSDYDTSNYRFTPSEAGKYFIYAQVHGNSGAGGSGSSAGNFNRLHARLYKNGSQIAFAESRLKNQSQTWTSTTERVEGIFTANGSSDYFEFFAECRSHSGGGNNFSGGSDHETFWGAYKIIE